MRLIRFWLTGLITICFFSFFVNAGTTYLSLSPDDWTEYGTVTSSRSKETYNGYLRFKCNTYRGYIGYRTVETFNIQGGVVRFKWKMSSASNNYCWSNNGTNVAIGFGRYFNIHHVWDKGIAVIPDRWIYTELVFNDNKTYSWHYSYNGYSQGEIFSGSGVLSDAQFESIKTSSVVIRGGDNYTTPMILDIDEVHIIVDTPPLTVDINSPASDLYYEPNDIIFFTANAQGGEKPYTYQWSSNIDGALSDSNSFSTSELSIGQHLIMVQCQDANSDIATDGIYVNIIEPPVIEDIPDETISEGSYYYSPVPVVNSSAGAVTWTRTSGPADMALNSSNGQVSWWTPVVSDTPYTITIRAENPVGYDTQSWQLTVVAKPDIAEISDDTILEGSEYTSPTPSLTKGENITWSLDNAPSGTTIDPNTGIVIWSDTIASFAPYEFIIRATNSFGYDTENWLVTVESPPIIASITEAAVETGEVFSYTPSLIKGLPSVSWTKIAGPDGLTVDLISGQMSWSQTSVEDVYDVTIAAENTHGSDHETFQIKVQTTPQIDNISDQTINEGTAFSLSPNLIKGTGIIWSLVNPPAGVTINPSTGLVLWNKVIGNYSPYTITVKAQNYVGSDQKSFSLIVARPPIIVNIDNDITADGGSYTSPVPSLYQGTAPVSWSIETAPAGSSIDPTTGVITLEPASYDGFDIDIVIKAQNTAGFDTEQWQVEIVRPPLINAFEDETIVSNQSYISKTPTLSQGTHITWSIVASPEGVSINPSTGRISWASPVSSDTAYEIVIQAENIAGFAQATLYLTVLDKPVIGIISDDTANEWQEYVSALPVLVQGALPVQWSLVKAPVGMTINADTGVVSWTNPAASASPYEIEIKAQNIVGSDQKTWKLNVPPGYTAQVATAIDTATSGSSVPLTGIAIWNDSGTPAANVPVKIAVELKGMTRILSTITDSVGNINTVFNPLAGEAGLYSITASHPIESFPPVQDQFILVALKSAPKTIAHTMYESETIQSNFEIQNLGDTPLTGITYQVNSPNNIDVQINLSADMAGLETQTVDCNFTALDASIANPSVDIVLTSTEGANAIHTINLKVNPLLPHLTVDPISLKAGMTRGKRTTVQLQAFNTGGTPTPELTVLIPDADWISMANPEVIGSIDANDSKIITLELSPSSDAPLGNYTGSVLIYGNGINKTIPFEFACVSDAIGGLYITATDEYTYYAAGFPNVSDATLSLKDLITGQIYYYNEPMPDGRLILENLPESYYELEVRAPEHDIYKDTVIVVPGINSPVLAFMSRQLVSYTWIVVPTTIPDIYTVTLTQTYSTSVPAPVVVIEPSNVDLSDIIDGEKQVNFTITNHGLVAAEEFHLSFNDHPRYVVELLVDFNGRIDPETTIIIPAIIRDTQYVQPVEQMTLIKVTESDNLNDTCDPVTGGGYYTLVCGDDKKWHKQPITIANWLCDLYNLLPSLPGGGYDNYGGDPSGNTPDPTEPTTPRLTTPGGGAPGGGGSLTFTTSVLRGTTPLRPTDPITTITLPNLFGGGGGGGCDPCPRKQLDALLNCALGFFPSCPFQIVLNGYNCVEACYNQGILSQHGYITCGHGLISSITGCVKDAAGTLTGFGIVWNLIGCLYGVVNACQDLDAVMYEHYASQVEMLTSGDFDLPPTLPDSADAIANLAEQIDRLTVIIEAFTELLGHPAWFSGQTDEADEYIAIMTAFADAIDPVGELGARISTNERTSLLSIEAPVEITADVVGYTCDRWNRTLDYWDAGKFTVADLEPNDNTDFVDSSIYMEKWISANDKVIQMQAEGFDTLLGSVRNAVDNLQVALEGSDEGVCAKVKVEIDQRVVMSRSAFRATLTMTNNSQVDSLEGITVDVEITDLYGNTATSLFGIYPPDVTGISDLDGNGNLTPSQTMQANWTIVPTNQAAPLASVDYLVGGEISYTINGSLVNIPLSPAIITVKPDPRLSVKYFFETDVYSDDPFTSEIEPAVPFSLGMMVSNNGAGTAYDFSITSALPEIIRHEGDKDIIISFDLIGTSINNKAVTPALALDMGSIDPNETMVARWLMTTTLQGEFIDYNAVFAHIDPLGDPKLSLIDSMTSYELVHTVQADCPQDDGICDFLTNDVPDINGLADTVHLSDGSVETVQVMAGDSSWLSINGLNITLTTPHMPLGFVYIRVPNIYYGSYELVSVMRSDGKIIKVDQNAWTTHKTIYEIGQEPYEENYLHIFDCDGDGQYTLTFIQTGDEVPVVHDVNIADITSDIGSELYFDITYTDNNAVDDTTLDSMDIRVFGPYGYSTLAEFVRSQTNYNSSIITASYAIAAPGDVWDSADNGMYQLYMEYEQVADESGNFVLPGIIAGFVVNFPAECNDLEVVSYNLIDQRRVDRTVFDYDYSVTLKNNCMNPVKNFRFVPIYIPDVMTLIYDDVFFDHISPFDAATSQGFFTVRMDSQAMANIIDMQWEAKALTNIDFSGNGSVGFEDLAILCQYWLTDNSNIDIAPLEPDGIINFIDFAYFVDQWVDTE